MRPTAAFIATRRRAAPAVFQRYFGDQSLFNVPIASMAPVYYPDATQAQWRTNIKNAISGINVNGGNGAWAPVINIADASTPIQATVAEANAWIMDSVPVSPSFTWSHLLNDTDRWAAIVDTVRGRNHSFFGAGRDTSGRWTTYAGVIEALNGSGWWDSQYKKVGATDASAPYTGPGAPHFPGMSMLAGTILAADAQQGVIPHALKHAMPFSAVQAGQWAYPATGGVDGQGQTGMPYGLRIQFDPTIDIYSSSFQIKDRNTNALRAPNQTELLILQALQTYGSWHCDNSGLVVFYGQNVSNLTAQNGFPSWWSWAGLHKDLIDNIKFLQSPQSQYVPPYETRYNWTNNSGQVPNPHK